jgi:hypothetical protein
MAAHGEVRGVFEKGLVFLDFLVFLAFLSVATLFPATRPGTASYR